MLYPVVNFRGVIFYLTGEELQLQHGPSYIKVGRIKQLIFFEARAKGFLGKNPGAFAGIWTKDRVDEVVRCLTSPSVM